MEDEMKKLWNRMRTKVYQLTIGAELRRAYDKGYNAKKRISKQMELPMSIADLKSRMPEKTGYDISQLKEPEVR
jgi:hypothetical protein